MKIEQIDNQVLNVNNLRVFVDSSPFVQQHLDDIYYVIMDTRLRLELRDYELFKRYLGELRKELGEPLKYKHNFYAGGSMIFVFYSPYIDLWFRCLPDEIPEDLLPSKTCKVERFEYKETDYRLVCEVPA